jgi:hypothetical protein
MILPVADGGLCHPTIFKKSFRLYYLEAVLKREKIEKSRTIGGYCGYNARALFTIYVSSAF